MTTALNPPPLSPPEPEWTQAVKSHLEQAETLLREQRERAGRHMEGATGAGRAVEHGLAAAETLDRVLFYMQQARIRCAVAAQRLAFADEAVAEAGRQRGAMLASQTAQ